MTTSSQHDVLQTPLTLLDRAHGAGAERFPGLPAWVVLTEFFIGCGWIRAGVEKVIESAWWSGESLLSFLADHEHSMLGWYEPLVALLLSLYAVHVAAAVALSNSYRRYEPGRQARMRPTGGELAIRDRECNKERLVAPKTDRSAMMAGIPRNMSAVKIEGTRCSLASESSCLDVRYSTGIEASGGTWTREAASSEASE